jgi:hypothetical protein
VSFLKKLAPIAGALIGASTGLGPVFGSALGSGIGSLLAGAELDDALKAAAIAGVGGYALKGAGPQTTASGLSPEAMASASKMEMGEGLAKGFAQTGAQTTASQAAQSGILASIKENPGLSAAIASLGLGALSEGEQEERELTELEKRQQETGERIPGYKGKNIVLEYDYPEFVKKFMQGGYIEGPGTGKSDSINSGIYQNGMKVQEARLSDGEFVMTERAVRGLGKGDRGKGAAKMYEMMRKYEAMA